MFNFEHAQFSNNLSTSINGPWSRNEHPHAKFWPYFGQDSSAIQKPADWSYPREVYNLPEGLKGNNYFISRLLISQISKADQVWIREVLPWFKWEGGNEIKWDVWKFHDHLLNRTPEQSVSRMLTSNRDQKNATITRYGIAFMAEHGFMMTPQGRIAYAMNMQQIVNATVETLCLGVMEAILFVEYDRWTDATITAMSTRAQLEDKVNVEINDFACIQKGRAGIFMRMEDMKITFRKRTGKEPNMFVFGPGALTALKMMGASLEKTYYVGASSTIDSTEKRARVGNGTTLLEMRSVRASEGAQAINPAEVRTVLGGFTELSVNKIRGVTPESFRTELLNRDIHVDKADDYYTLQFKKLLPLTGLYVRADGAPLGGGGGGKDFGAAYGGGGYDDKTAAGKGPTHVLSELGRQFYSSYRTWGEYMRDRGVMTNWAKSFLSKSSDVQQAFIDQCIGTALHKSRTTGDTRAGLAARSGGIFDSAWFERFLLILKSEAGKQAAAGLSKKAASAPASERKDDGGSETLQGALVSIAGKASSHSEAVMALMTVLLGPMKPYIRDEKKAALVLKALELSMIAGTATFPDASTYLAMIMDAVNKETFPSRGGLSFVVYSQGVGETLEIDVDPQYFTDDEFKAMRAVTRTFQTAGASLTKDEAKNGVNLDRPPLLDLHAHTALSALLRQFSVDGKVADLQSGLTRVYAQEQAARDTTYKSLKALAAAESKRASGTAGRLGRLEQQRKPSGGDRVPQRMQKEIGNLYYIAREELDAIYSRRVLDEPTFASGAEFAEMMKGVGAAYASLTDQNNDKAAQNTQDAETGLSMLLSEFYEETLLMRNPGDKGIPAEARTKRDAKAGYKPVFEATIAQLALMNRTMGEIGMEMYHKKVQPGVFRDWLEAQGSNQGRPGETLFEIYQRLGRGDNIKAATAQEMKDEDFVRPGQFERRDVERLLDSLSIDNADILQWTADNDCWPLLQLVSWAPAKTYMTSPMIALRGYGELGKTLYGYNNFELGDDPARKVHYGHFTLNAKPLVMDEKYIEHRYHCHVSRYVSGNDGEHWNPNSMADRQRWEARSSTKSRIVSPVHPDDDLSSKNYMFITGRPPVELGGDDASIPSEPEGHEATARFWGLQHPVSLLQQAPYRTDGLRYNTMCFREHSRGAVMTGKDSFDPVGHVELDKGHFGIDFGYPGSSRIYTGGAPYLVKPNFSATSQRLLLDHS